MEAFYNTPPTGQRCTSSYLTKAVCIQLLRGDFKPSKDDPCLCLHLCIDTHTDTHKCRGKGFAISHRFHSQQVLDLQHMALPLAMWLESISLPMVPTTPWTISCLISTAEVLERER
ncbi:hypothetical protein CRUP_036712 [Coryphaenoides rupestris]|nr:hypothetical protein CRUP_036712 [Coryphaenoides rupestris]